MKAGELKVGDVVYYQETFNLLLITNVQYNTNNKLIRMSYMTKEGVILSHSYFPDDQWHNWKWACKT